MKGCKRVVSKGVPMNHDRRGKNGSWLKKCERYITERMLKVNHGAGDIRVWHFLDNIKSLSKLEYTIFLIFLRFFLFLLIRKLFCLVDPNFKLHHFVHAIYTFSAMTHSYLRSRHIRPTLGTSSYLLNSIMFVSLSLRRVHTS